MTDLSRSIPEAVDVTPATGATPPYEAVIFDMDGVVTDTAELHAAAWKQLFDEVLADHRDAAGRPVAPFDADADYRVYVDGRTREDGVSAFLTARGIDVPAGDEGDAADARTVHGLAARKNALFLRLLEERGARVFPATVALLRRLRAGGVPTAVVTASRNAAPLLASAGVRDLFDAVVDGTDAASLALPGKPDPAMFLEAARRLGVAPHRAAVIEDAIAGVQSADRGGFGLVVGIDRGGHRDALEAAGADVVVGDVAELDLGVLRAGPWRLVYEGFDPAHEGHREALTTLGNGHLGTRGAAPERAADRVHYPGTYLAGVYNRLVSSVQGLKVEDEHLVNVSNWLLLDLRIGDGAWWSAGGLRVAWERRELDLRRALLTRRCLLVDPAGRNLHVIQRRLVSMSQPHVAALETTLIPDGWSGSVSIRSGVDNSIRNTNVAEYAALANRHLVSLTAGQVDGETLVTEVETSQSHIRVATAARTRVDGVLPGHDAILEGGRAVPALRFDVQASDGALVVIDKTVALVTSRDRAIASPREAAVAELRRATGAFDALLARHAAAWRRLWDLFGLDLDADAETRLVLNLHVFHLLQAVSPNTADLDAGVHARGLHGEGYRGHVFWDELFVLPLVTLRLPAVSQALLDYRWQRLDAARQAARAAGLDGALFPWQSGSDGREETPQQLYNPRSQRWMPDNSRRQRHVGLAVAYNAWQHYEATNDVAWLAGHGAELIIEVTRLFTALATYDEAEDRFHINGVMGPDEYHDGYPDAPGAGLRDNAYTNVLAAWVCQRALDSLEVLAGPDRDDLIRRLGIRDAERTKWARLARRLAVPFHSDGVISQFDGYHDLEELDWQRYRTTYGNIGRLDLILEAEGDSTNRYKLAKQADVLMLLYLFGADDLVALLGRLGYTVASDDLVRTVDYYLARTAHGSTLSRIVHASVLARFDPSRAWSTFRDAMAADLDDTQGGTTREGIHLGAMAGTVDLVLRTFAGLRVGSNSLALDPSLPDGLRCARFRLRYRNQHIDVSVDRHRLRLFAHPCVAAPVRVTVAGTLVTITGGETRDVVLQH